VARGVGHATAIYAKRAKNAEIWSEDGRRYIDFAAGIAVVNTGHQHPKIIAAVEEQLRAFSHVCFQVTPYETYIRLAERLNAIAPVPRPAKTMLVSTGAEAVENAVKVARAFTRRPGIVSFSGGFHGRTHMGMALTGKVVPYKKGFGPFPADVYNVAFPDTYHGVTVEQSLQSLNSLFKHAADPSSIAAIIIEPVQGEGGFNIAPFDHDVWDMAAFVGRTHVSQPERDAFAAFESAGLIDALRSRGVEGYTYWDYQQLRFPRNEGMRIDFILGSKAFDDLVTDARIDRNERKGVAPSDHVPVVVSLDLATGSDDDRPMIF